MLRAPLHAPSPVAPQSRAEPTAAPGERAASPPEYGHRLSEIPVLDESERVRRAAKSGVSGAGGRLPHLEPIQRSFGRHDLSGLIAHVGPPATVAARALGAEAFTHGAHVAFAAPPDLRTAAHEAAHAVQQRAGDSPSGALGEPGDRWERQADVVAERVTRGLSSEGFLPSGGGEWPEPRAVQRVITKKNQAVIAALSREAVIARMRNPKRGEEPEEIARCWLAAYDLEGDPDALEGLGLEAFPDPAEPELEEEQPSDDELRTERGKRGKQQKGASAKRGKLAHHDEEQGEAQHEPEHEPEPEAQPEAPAPLPGLELENGWHPAGDLFPGYTEMQVDGGRVIRLRGKSGGKPWTNDALTKRFKLSRDRRGGDQTPNDVRETFHTEDFRSARAAEEPPPPKAGSVGYVATVPVPFKQGTGDNTPAQLAHHYLTALPEAEIASRMRLIIGINLLDDVRDPAGSTPAAEKLLRLSVAEAQAAIGSHYVTVIGYLLSPHLSDGFTGKPVSTDYVRQVSRVTPDASVNFGLVFPFAGIRQAMASSDVAQAYIADLHRHNADVFLHTGDSDLVSLMTSPGRSVFDEFGAVIGKPENQDAEGRTTLGRVGGSFAFSEQDIRGHIQDQYLPAEETKIAHVTMLFNMIDQEFRAIMSSGAHQAGWFAEPNTLINARLLDDPKAGPAIHESLGQAAATKMGKPDYFLPLHAALIKLAGEGGEGGELPTRSLFLPGPEHRLLTSARKDVLDSAANADSTREFNRVLSSDNGRNLQFRSSQVAPVAKASYGITDKKATTLFNAAGLKSDSDIEVSQLREAHPELAEKFTAYVELREIAIKSIEKIQGGEWDPTLDGAAVRKTVDALIAAIDKKYAPAKPLPSKGLGPDEAAAHCHALLVEAGQIFAAGADATQAVAALRDFVAVHGAKLPDGQLQACHELLAQVEERRRAEVEEDERRLAEHRAATHDDFLREQSGGLVRSADELAALGDPGAAITRVVEAYAWHLPTLQLREEFRRRVHDRYHDEARGELVMPRPKKKTPDARFELFLSERNVLREWFISLGNQHRALRGGEHGVHIGHED